MKSSTISRRFGLWLFTLMLLGVVALSPLSAHSAATIVIVNNDAAGEGLNDPTPVDPVGGNPGTTLGQQRLMALQYAANIWGANLTSLVPIRIGATFDPLSCTATAANVAAGSPTEMWANFSGGPFANTWYPKALANKIAGVDLDPTEVDITARFNVNLGQTGCLTGTFFYLGLDNNHGSDIDLVTRALHEFAHGLGFFTSTSGTSGAFVGFPSVFDHFVFDLTANKTWAAMTDAERVASAVNTRKVVWNGVNVSAAVPTVLASGTPELSVSAPPSYGANGVYQVGLAVFGPPLSSPGIMGQIMPVTTPTAGGMACGPLTSADVLAVNGSIALIDRGICTFVTKVKNAQNAGAIGVIIADNLAGSPPGGLGGTDPTITIPSVRITQADGAVLKNALRFRSRTKSGVIGTLGVDMNVRLGASPDGRALLWTPNPYQRGTSVSSWDIIAFPNLLMEAEVSPDVTHNVDVPYDLTLPLLKDIGW